MGADMVEVTERTRSDIASRYDEMWHSIELRPERLGSAMAMAQKINRNRERYEQISMSTGVPWHVIGMIHARESSCDFSKHLHNGDRLTHRTVQVPKGRPKKGEPPFTFEESAIDALQLDGLDRIKDWSSAGIIAKELEEFNGVGYRTKGVPSPYLWAGSSHYLRGKFVADHKYNAKFVDPQSGVMTVLKCLTQIDPSLDPDFKPVVVADPLPPAHPVVVAAQSKTVQASIWSAVWFKITTVAGGVKYTIDSLVSVAPDVKADVDDRMSFVQSFASTMHIDWDTVGTWVAIACLLYAISRHVDLKQWLHGAKEVAV